MGVALRVVLDQLSQIIDADQAAAAVALTKGLISTAPRGCEVEAIVPSGSTVDISGISQVRTLALGRRELAASWNLGIAPGVGTGLIHAPTLLAPLVRHDRVNDAHQIVVTLWDLRPWESPETLPKAVVSAQRGLLRRALKHADAIVVPSHHMADRLVSYAAFGERVRVIAGAVADGFALPTDADWRRQSLFLPEKYVVLTGTEESLAHGFRAAAAADVDAVVIEAEEGSEPRLADLAAASGLAENRAHVRGALSATDRAVVLAGAAAFVATSELTVWPWRALEAIALNIPIVAVETGLHRDVIAEGGLLVAAEELPDALTEAVSGGAARLRVLAADRSRAFSWRSAAERVWALHADL